jgi:hypothetical protein
MIKMEVLFFELLARKYIPKIDVDPGVFHAINRGIIIGSFILSFFILFPGEPFEYRATARTGDDKSSCNDDNENRTIRSDGQNKRENNNKSIEERFKEEIESIDASWSIYELANVVFYILIFLGGLYIFHHVYGISLVEMVKFHFPREAAVFGLY